MSWRHQPVLKVSTKEVGTIIADDNSGRFRSLTASFAGREETFHLANVGFTSGSDFAWWHDRSKDEDFDGEGEWVSFNDGIPERVEGPTPVPIRWGRSYG